MTCKKHLTDLSSGVGVCATCLQERLLCLVAAQTRFERATAAAPAISENRRQHEPPPLLFPWSVSPYVSRRKSDDDGTTWIHQQRSYRTPQVNLTTATADFDAASTNFKKKHGFSLFSSLFGTRSNKYNSDPTVHHHREPCDEQSSSSSSSSPSWLSAIFTTVQKSQQSSRISRVDYCSQFAPRDRRSYIDRGMSPAIESNSGGECDRPPSGSSPEVSPRWKRSPTSARRVRTGSRNKSGTAFCLSPLARANSNQHSNQRTEPAPELTFTSESRPPMKPHLDTAVGFCTNRSKKIADLGRV